MPTAHANRESRPAISGRVAHRGDVRVTPATSEAVPAARAGLAGTLLDSAVQRVRAKDEEDKFMAEIAEAIAEAREAALADFLLTRFAI